jgi:hypothetical protein
MQDTLLQDRPLHRRGAQIKPTLRIFTACEDKSSFYRARKVQRKVEQLCSDQINILPMFWTFPLLRHQGLRECAVTEAANSEMIIVSFRGNTELAPHVKCWLESLPGRSQDGQAALVALPNFAVEDGARHADISYLRQIAESRGMDFFCHRSGWEAPVATAPRSELGRFAGRSITPDTMFSNVVPWHPGGIND